MRLPTILLAVSLFASGNAITTVKLPRVLPPNLLQDAQKEGRLLRTSVILNEDDEERAPLASLMKHDDEVAAIKQLASEFKDLNKIHHEALDVIRVLRKRDMTEEEATYVGNLYAKYLQDPKAYH
ncbi:hypothetical protein PC129_g17343 [Phytophthora cactorum]|uniref:RxLR effector protein n=1 Tax=Phytophthora cactorum TaxID=29920 RepID=A0A329SLS5_9STRA|nr:hypothetical protein Pcac1_g4916 [Phytophthora cactorum]KAG2807423.1 hypothetical protein PC111_g16943 [Phytophthora cactorum]KAG2820079.1 hypothetical protein PC112_g11923 [Phytophthora cactorum]KAG2858942.1 hypothetical protein PC113_g9371 [Phytophthora cactorum]KAG2909791.1 hypothetical protein PC114_g9980 [Phytophthora cactorum]